MLKKKIKDEGWYAETELLTIKQIASLFSRENQNMQRQCWVALQNTWIQQEQEKNSLMAREQIALALINENREEIEIIAQSDGKTNGDANSNGN